jgi:hypothetical protein
MPINRRKMFAYAGAAVAAPALLREGHAQAAEVNLKLHHFLPAASNIHQKFLTPLVRKIEAESNGRIKIDDLSLDAARRRAAAALRPGARRRRRHHLDPAGQHARPLPGDARRWNCPSSPTSSVS